MAAKNAADVGCDIVRAYLEELQLLGVPCIAAPAWHRCCWEVRVWGLEVSGPDI